MGLSPKILFMSRHEIVKNVLEGIPEKSLDEIFAAIDDMDKNLIE